MQSRRKFLSVCSALSAAALVFPKTILAGAVLPLWRQRSLEDMSCETFAGQLNTTFWIHAAPARSIQVKLVEARPRQDRPLKPGQRPPGDAGNEKFSLFFSGHRSELLPQNTYTFEHEALGRFDLFIVPVGTRNPLKITYQMVFNRPRRRGTPRQPWDARSGVPGGGGVSAMLQKPHNKTKG
jgi:hypothetical protein